MNTTETLDRARYGALLADALPTAIRTEEANERALAQIRQLMERGEDSLTLEESALLDLLSDLVERFEEQHYPMLFATPLERLQALMDRDGLSAPDLHAVFGTRSRTSEVLNGKRAISKEQAKRLGETFGVSASLFL